MSKWDELSIAEKAEMMKVAVRQGITNLSDIRQKYNEFAEGGSVREENLFPIGGLMPINFPLAIRGAKETAKDVVRKRLYNNVYPFGYNNPAERLYSAIVLNKPSEKQEYVGNRQILDDLWGTYLGIPDNQRHYNRVLQESEYRPTIAKNKNTKYYKLPYSPEEQEIIIREGLFGNDKLLNPELGTFTIGSGHDSKGHYISYYDPWNLNPFTGITNVGNKATKLLGLDRVEDLSMGIGKPIEIYDRIYLDDYYGVKGKDRGGHYLPEITVFANPPKEDDWREEENTKGNYANGGGIHIKPSHRGRLTELKKRTGKTEAELYNDGNPAHKKMVVFARNSRKWKHGLGGNLYGLGGNRIVTTGGAGYVPTFTAENAEHTLKTIANDYLFGDLPIDTIRQRLYDNITPIGYNDVIKRVKNAVKDNKREDIKGLLDSSFEFNEQGYNMQRDALWAQYLQIPENKRHRLYDLYNKSARLKKAEYQPSIGKKSNMFYSLTLPGYIKDKVVEEGIGLNYNDGNVITARNLKTFKPSALGNYLGDYTVSKGHDEKGSYISYYDMWDLDPFFKNKGDNSMGIGKPIPIYDRIYLDDYYGVKEPTHATYLPEVTVLGNKKAEGGPIHIAPSKRGTFTAAATKHGKSVQEFASQVLAHKENYSPAMVKKANFARNASKWKHGLGGNLFE